jgi:hypothetical protein
MMVYAPVVELMVILLGEYPCGLSVEQTGQDLVSLKRDSRYSPKQDVPSSFSNPETDMKYLLGQRITRLCSLRTHCTEVFQ